MPRTLPAGMAQWMTGQSNIATVLLADIQTADGTNYFWTDVEGSYPSIITGATQFYTGWVKSAGPFYTSKDLSTNAGDFAVQNLSGNTINRDVSSALLAHEIEGALCIVRLWLPLFDASMMSFHGTLSEQDPKEDEATFRHLQLFDSTQYDFADDLISELCIWRYKSVMCGSTSSATVCDKLFPTCVGLGATERFSGVLTIVPNAGVNTPPVGVSPISPIGGGGDGGGRGFGLNQL